MMSLVLQPQAWLIAMAGGQGQEGSNWMLWVMLLALAAIWYFLLIRPQQQKKQEHQDMVDNLEVGDRVVTTGGIHGQIKSLSDDTVKLQVAKNFKITVNRGSISSVKGKNGDSDS